MYLIIYLEKRRKGKQPVSKTKKQKNNSNKESTDEIILIEDSQCDQNKMNNLALKKLDIQKQLNDELEREITLLEKRKQLLDM